MTDKYSSGGETIYVSAKEINGHWHGEWFCTCKGPGAQGESGHGDLDEGSAKRAVLVVAFAHLTTEHPEPGH